MDANEKLEALKKFHKQMEGKNYFELLGVPEDVDDAGVRSAYFELMKIYNADYFHHVVEPVARQAVEDVNKTLREAYNTLMKTPSREKYLNKLKGIEPDEADHEINIADVFEGEQALTQARFLMERGDYKMALVKLDKAHRLDPKSLEVSVRHAFSRYMMMEVNSEGKRNRAEVDKIRDELNSCVQELPKADYLRVFLGIIERMEGNNDAAKKWIDEAIKLNADNVVAKREKRLLEQSVSAEEEPAKPEGFMAQLKGIIDKLKSIKIG